MNFLAHIFLSGENEKLLIGNFIADFIKGNRYQHLETEIQKGILLHRQIDTFTDNHLIVRQSTKRLQSDFGKYAGVITDVFYDHFLAKNFHLFSDIDLQDFAAGVYQIFTENEPILPEKVQEFLPYMIRDNWLWRYADLGGIHHSLKGISKRSLYASNLESAVQNLEQDYVLFGEDFINYFPELQGFVKKHLEAK